MNKKITLFFFIFFFILTQITQAQTHELWGMTYEGGDSSYNGSGSSISDGAIINLDLGLNNVNVKYNFTAKSGIYPSGSLLQANDGNLYGVTSLGANGNGGIFKYDPSNKSFNVIHYFTDTDGSQPLGTLIQAQNGLLYGTCSGGGAYGYGVIFSVNPSDTLYTDLHDFDSTDGAVPYYEALVQATNGKLYGTCSVGGENNKGVIFSFNPTDNNYTKLFDFNTGATGASPFSGLLQANDGNLYGLTESGGANGAGVLFSIDTLGKTYTDLFDFVDSTGANPYGSLIQAGDGKLYGMTNLGGVKNGGVIFNFNITGSKYSKLYDFSDSVGTNPYGSLLQASDGKFYGMTSNGGNESLDFGSLFSFDAADTTYDTLRLFNGTIGKFPYGNLIEIISTGINQLSAIKNQLSLYPNPTNGLVTITSTQNIDQIKVTDILGQMVLKSTLGDLGMKRFTFELKQAGIYFVTATSSNQTTTKKIVVSN